MAKKFYAIKKGKQEKIVEGWEQCKALVNGVAGVVFKGFNTYEEATEYLHGKEDAVEKSYTGLSKVDCVAYIDGSYNIKTNTFGYGAVIFYGDEKKVLYGSSSDGTGAEHRNVAGELVGVAKVILFAESRGIKNISFYYDYEGIKKWATGEWKANKEFTISYKQFMLAKMKMININFIKVKAHTGDKYNEEADKLAKKSVGLL